jgi:hypothetical protein
MKTIPVIVTVNYLMKNIKSAICLANNVKAWPMIALHAWSYQIGIFQKRIKDASVQTLSMKTIHCNA